PTYPFQRRTCWIDCYQADRPLRELDQEKDAIQACDQVSHLKDDLREIFLHILKLQPRDLEEAQTFQDLGIGSVNVIQLLGAINSKYHLSLTTSVLFECRNIDALVDYIKESLPIDTDRSGVEAGSSPMHASASKFAPVGSSPFVGFEGGPLEGSL